MSDTDFTNAITLTDDAWFDHVNNLTYQGKNPIYVTTTGAANAQILTLPATSLLSALVAGQEFTFRAGYTNTAAMTLQIVGASALAAKNVYYGLGPVLSGHVVVNNIYTVIYDGTQWQIQQERIINVRCFGALGDGSTNDTAAIVAAEAALPSGNGSGELYFPAGTYLTTGWTPVRTGIIVRGDGQYASFIKGSGAGTNTVTLSGISRSVWKDINIDGGGIKTAAMLTAGNNSQNTFINVRFMGSTTTTVNLGVAGGSDDVSENAFINCTIQSNSATQGQLKLRGNNTSGNWAFGGHFSTGSAASGNAIDIDDGGEFTCFGTNLLGLASDYAIKASSGTIKCYGGHCEAGGAIWTLVGDARTDSTTSPHVISNVSMATSGATAIEHLAARTLILEGGYCGNSNVHVGTGAKLIETATTAMASGVYVIDDGGTLILTKDRPEDGLTAHAGGTKAAALQLATNKTWHRVSVVGSAADSVLMPQATVGQRHYVRNDGANAMQVFGKGTDTINGVATGTGISQGVGTGLWYVCLTAGQWVTT